MTGRRTFLKGMAGGAVLAAAGGILGGLSPAARAAAATTSNDLTWLPAWRIRELIGKKEVSPVEVMNHFLARIEEHNPTLRAFTHLDAAGAREQAKRAEEAVRRGDRLGPLHGIPISVKEHIAVAGMPVMGVRRAGNAIAARDDVGVARLRAAGAVIVGTNTMMGTSAPAPGQYNWEAEARNPWDPTRAPGWSSSGGAAAAAARLLPITIGSDGGGSTRLPGAISGVIGVHPSVGRIPTVSYERPSLNLTGTIGPLARDARDAAMTMQVLAGPDGRDFVCIKDPAPDYLSNLDKGVSGMRFAWTDDYGYGPIYKVQDTARVVAAVRQAAMGFTKLGAKVEPTAEQWEDFWPSLGITQQIFAGGTSAGEGVNAPRPTPEQIQNALETRGRNWQRFHSLFSKYDAAQRDCPVHGLQDGRLGRGLDQRRR
jgi:Asp-tRNA(Asn)/Glu-tRNA(Gln) amidotransferase A subunit family amidase